jgi:hypothetical protein
MLVTVVNNSNYVLVYWIQRERWQEFLYVLKRQTDLEIFYSSGCQVDNNHAEESVKNFWPSEATAR